MLCGWSIKLMRSASFFRLRRRPLKKNSPRFSRLDKIAIKPIQIKYSARRSSGMLYSRETCCSPYVEVGTERGTSPYEAVNAFLAFLCTYHGLSTRCRLIWSSRLGESICFSPKLSFLNFLLSVIWKVRASLFSSNVDYFLPVLIILYIALVSSRFSLFSWHNLLWKKQRR